MISFWTNLTIAQAMVVSSVVIGTAWIVTEITSYESDKKEGGT